MDVRHGDYDESGGDGGAIASKMSADYNATFPSLKDEGGAEQRQP